jgi:hypothetical protein
MPDVVSPVPLIVIHGEQEDHEASAAVSVQPCTNCGTDPHCGHVYAVVHVVGHPDGHDFDLIFEPEDADRLVLQLRTASAMAKQQREAGLP